MRSVIISVVGAVIAIAIALVFSISVHKEDIPGEDGAAVSGNTSDPKRNIETMSDDIKALRQELTGLSERIDSVQAQIKIMEAKPSGSAGIPTAPQRDGSTPSLPGLSGMLRSLVREEVVRGLEEERTKKQKDLEARQPEDWEREEFGHYAWYVHDTGMKLELTKEQKRQYYALIKENTESTGGLWGALQKEFPNSENAKLSEMYRERVQEGLKSTRRMVMDILNKEQQDKYEELCRQSEWFK